MCLIAEITGLLGWGAIILKVAIGLGAVIFVHELGHFLVAKACGVKCEKFFIGFDIGGYKLSHKWGETEYGIGILPLGGYVKMLGQDDDPAHIAEQLEKSQVTTDSGDSVEITGPEGETYTVDRRSYLAKSVPQRMAIISAGVVMNIIFAFIFAVVAFGLGVPYMPCIVSETIPGSPAWRSGIEVGDEIVQLGDRENPSFSQLLNGVTLADLENGVPCIVRRAEDGEVVNMVLLPEQGAKGLAKVGIVSPQSLTLFDSQPVLEGSPAARAKLVGTLGAPAESDGEAEAGFRGGDQIIRIGDTPVDNYRQYVGQLARAPDQPLLITVSRTLNAGAVAEGAGAEIEELTFEVGTEPMKRFGLVMTMGPITAMQPDSPALEAGLMPGDVLVALDGGQIDPVALSDVLRQAAIAGRTVILSVVREGNADEPLSISITPRVPQVLEMAVAPNAPMSAPAIGFAYRVESNVLSVQAGSPAAAGGFKAGDIITSAKFILPEDFEGKLEMDPLVLSEEHPNWPLVMESIQLLPAGTKVALAIQRGEEMLGIEVMPAEVDDLFVGRRGFLLKPVQRIRMADSFPEQVQLGWDETVSSLTMVFRFLQKIGTQVPITALGGPVTIAKAAGYSADEGIGKLLVFLTMLSANLAVINFLPIPLLDGGHMVFLAWEGIRGRPASEKFVVAMHTAGFLFIISLMLFVIALDLNLIPRNL